MPKEDKHAPAEKVDIDLLENERLTEAKDDDESIDQADVPNKKDEGEKMDSVTTKAEAGTPRRQRLLILIMRQKSRAAQPSTRLPIECQKGQQGAKALKQTAQQCGFLLFLE